VKIETAIRAGKFVVPAHCTARAVETLKDIIHTIRPVKVAVHAVERTHHATASARASCVKFSNAREGRTMLRNVTHLKGFT